MDDKIFQATIEENKGCAVILAGSDSDKLHIDKIVDSLRHWEVPFQVRISSAHKQPEKTSGIVHDYNEVEGSITYIAVAGGTDALSGLVSFHSYGPVISCPPDHLNESCLTNPPGSSNAYIGDPSDIGKFIAQTYAGINPRFNETSNSVLPSLLDLFPIALTKS